MTLIDSILLVLIHYLVKIQFYEQNVVYPSNFDKNILLSLPINYIFVLIILGFRTVAQKPHKLEKNSNRKNIPFPTMGNPNQPDYLHLTEADHHSEPESVRLTLLTHHPINNNAVSRINEAATQQPHPAVGRSSAKYWTGDPPDGGYGWVIVGVCMLTSTVIGIGFAGFSILYVEWTESFRAEKWVLGLVGSLHMASGNFLGRRGLYVISAI